MTMQEITRMIRVWSGVPTGLRIWKVKKRKHSNEKMKIVFVCQLSHLWGCLQSIYEEALEDAEVEPYVLAVPEYWGEEVDTSSVEYLENLGYAVIPAYDKKEKQFFDLKALNPDYVFLPRPYDSYLPEQYQSETLSHYTKVCYVCYGYTSEGDYMLKTAFSKYFTTNCYMVFAENASVADYCRRTLPISTRLGIRKIIQTPFPRFDLAKRFEGKEGAQWKRSRNEDKHRIIWTPRWTLDEKLGGSNFFQYKDFFFRFAKEHSENEVLIRPHPLAFGNFIKTGRMTEQEVAEYKETCQNMGNVVLDESKDFLDSFASADILVADLSGVVVEFAVTGKPVIYCSYQEIFNDANKELMDAYYVVHDEQELEQTLDMLCSGQDPKKEQRQRIVKKILGECDGMNGKRIMDFIHADYK